MNQFIQGVLGFLSLIQPSPELFADLRSGITFDRALIIGSLMGGIVWWRYQRSYCIEIQKQYSALLKEHAALATRLTGLESSFQKLQKTGVEALTAQNRTIESLGKNLKKQIDSVAQSAKQTADLATILTSSAAKHETELRLLMKLREQLLQVTNNQNAQIEELRGQIQKMISPASTISSATEQQKSKKNKPAKVQMSFEENQTHLPVYSGSSPEDSKKKEMMSRLNVSSIPPLFGRGLPNFGQGGMSFSGSNTLNFFPNNTNNSSTD